MVRVQSLLAVGEERQAEAEGEKEEREKRECTVLSYYRTPATARSVQYLSKLLALEMNHCFGAVQDPTARHLG